MRSICVTLSAVMYQELLTGHKATETSPAVRGCQNKEGVIRYLNDLNLFLGEVTDISVEE